MHFIKSVDLDTLISSKKSQNVFNPNFSLKLQNFKDCLAFSKDSLKVI